MLRLGMWVRAGGKTGIVTVIDAANDAVLVDFVDNKGDTTERAILFATAEVQQARIAHIPNNRRPNNPRALASLGYK